MGFKGVLDVQRESLKGVLVVGIKGIMVFSRMVFGLGEYKPDSRKIFYLNVHFWLSFPFIGASSVLKIYHYFEGGSWLVLTAIEGEMGKYRMVGWDGTWFWEDFWFGNCSFDWVFHSLALDQWWRFIITLRCGSGNWSVLTVIEREGVLSKREKKSQLHNLR